MWSFSYFQIPLWGLLMTVCFLDANASSCPKGWVSYVSNCYGLFPDNLTRNEAEAECKSLGQNSNLATINSDTAQGVIINYITTMFKGVGNVWIGLKDRWKIRTWRWDDGSKVEGLYWSSEAPTFLTTSKYCAYMIAAEGYKTWKDADCHEKYAYLCEMR